MNRREFLHSSAVAALAHRVLQGKPPSVSRPASQPAWSRPLIMDAYTRHLAWLRTPDEIAEAAIELTCGGVNPTIQEHPGHVNPVNVAQQLPVFVKTLRKHGLRVQQVRGGNQTAVTDPHVEAIVGTIGQLGVTHYWFGTDFYDLSKPILPQLDAIKRKAAAFVQLNEKHGTTLMYHTRAGARAVGSVVWDLLYVMQDFDPKYVGLHWDTGHMSHHGSEMWELLMRTAGPYLAGIGWKDRSWERADESVQPAAGPRGKGPSGGRGQSRWNSPYVPMGQGLVDIDRYAIVMRDIGFNGPMELQAEYPNGGSEGGLATLTLPPAQVLANLKRDVSTIRAAFERSDTGLTI